MTFQICHFMAILTFAAVQIQIIFTIKVILLHSNLRPFQELLVVVVQVPHHMGIHHLLHLFQQFSSCSLNYGITRTIWYFIIWAILKALALWYLIISCLKKSFLYCDCEIHGFIPFDNITNCFEMKYIFENSVNACKTVCKLINRSR